MMSSSFYHGYEDLKLKEREKYFSGLNWPEHAQYHEEVDNLLNLPSASSCENVNTNQPKFSRKKKSWRKYFSFMFIFQSKFTKQSETLSKRKKVLIEGRRFCTWKSKRGPILGPATGLACKLASIHEAIRKTTSEHLVGCLYPTKEDDIDVPYMQLEKSECYALRREAFGPIYMVT